MGVYIPLEGVDRAAFAEKISGSGLLGYIDTLAGGSISKVGVFSLGIVPYINSSIVFQLLASAIPQLQKLQKEEGESGRRQFNQYQRCGHADTECPSCISVKSNSPPRLPSPAPSAHSTTLLLRLRPRRYGALTFAVIQAVGQCLYLRPYVDDFSVGWLVGSSLSLTCGAMVLMWIGEARSSPRATPRRHYVPSRTAPAHCPCTINHSAH